MDVTFVNRAVYLGYKVVIVEKAIGFHFRSQAESGMEKKSSVEKNIILDYIDFLNPNISFIISLYRVFVRNFKEIIKAALQGNISYMLLGGRHLLHKLFLIPVVVRNRRGFIQRKKP